MNTNTTVDIEQIMNEIRANIAAKGYKDEILPFEPMNITLENEIEFDLQVLENAIAAYAAVNYINSHPAVSSQGGIRGKFTTFIKKVIRKMINFHITPIVWQINQCNSKALEIFIQTRDSIKYQGELDERLTLLELEFNRSIKKNYMLMEQKLDELSKENSMLKNLLEKQAVANNYEQGSDA